MAWIEGNNNVSEWINNKEVTLDGIKFQVGSNVVYEFGPDRFKWKISSIEVNSDYPADSIITIEWVDSSDNLYLGYARKEAPIQVVEPSKAQLWGLKMEVQQSIATWLYEVQSGDTLSAIVKKYYPEADQNAMIAVVMRMNGLIKAEDLQAGDTINLQKLSDTTIIINDNSETVQHKGIHLPQDQIDALTAETKAEEAKIPETVEYKGMSSQDQIDALTAETKVPEVKVEETNIPETVEHKGMSSQDQIDILTAEAKVPEAEVQEAEVQEAEVVVQDSGNVHIVEKGDTLSQLSVKLFPGERIVSMVALMKQLNEITDDKGLQIGQKLKLPLLTQELPTIEADTKNPFSSENEVSEDVLEDVKPWADQLIEQDTDQSTESRETETGARKVEPFNEAIANVLSDKGIDLENFTLTAAKEIIAAFKEEPYPNTWRKDELRPLIIAIQMITGADKLDGAYGNDTYSAVQAYQRKNNLKTDGAAGPITLTHMFDNI